MCIFVWVFAIYAHLNELETILCDNMKIRITIENTKNMKIHNDKENIKGIVEKG